MLKMTGFKPGDIIGFSSGDPIGWAINLGTLGWPFWPPCWRGLTHVAVVVECTKAHASLWESTTLCDLPCSHCGQVHNGLQCHDIPRRLESYRGSVWHYPLRVALSHSATHRLRVFAIQHHHIGYDSLGTIGSRSLCFGWLLRNFMRESLSSLFCSEFVAADWEAANVWDTPNVSTWNPNRLVRVATQVGLVKRARRLK